jgi:hypothetical protein
MEHRRFLAHPESHRPFVGGDIFARIGGAAAIDALIDGLYDRIETDTALRPLFGRDTTNERAAQKRFFTEWLGGERGYSDRRLAGQDNDGGRAMALPSRTRRRSDRRR